MVESWWIAWNVGLGHCLTMSSWWAELLRSSLWDYFVWLFCSLVYFETLRGREIFVVFFGYSQLGLISLLAGGDCGRDGKARCTHDSHVQFCWLNALASMCSSVSQYLQSLSAEGTQPKVGILLSWWAAPLYHIQSCVVHQQEIGKLGDVCAQTGKSLGNLETTVLASSSWQEHTVLRSHWNRS